MSIHVVHRPKAPKGPESNQPSDNRTEYERKMGFSAAASPVSDQVNVKVLHIAQSIIPFGGLARMAISIVGLITGPRNKRRYNGIPFLTGLVSHALYLVIGLAFLAAIPSTNPNAGLAHTDDNGNIVVGNGDPAAPVAVPDQVTDASLATWYTQIAGNTNGPYAAPGLAGTNQQVYDHVQQYLVTLAADALNYPTVADGVLDNSALSGPLSLRPDPPYEPNNTASLPDSTGKWLGGPGDKVRCLHGDMSTPTPSDQDYRNITRGTYWMHFAHRSVAVSGQPVDFWLASISTARQADCPAS